MHERSDREIFLASEERVHVGGSYFNPPDAVVRSCRRLELPPTLMTVDEMMIEGTREPTYRIAHLHSALTSCMAEGELLFAVYARRHYKLAPYLFDEEQCIAFEVQVLDGALQLVGYYGVPRMLAEEGLRRDPEV